MKSGAKGINGGWGRKRDILDWDWARLVLQVVTRFPIPANG
jgi:hypothetical protein